MERNDKSSSGTRAASSLRDRYPQLTRRQIEEALEAGLCTFEGRHLKKGDRISGPDVLDSRALDAHLQTLRVGNPSVVMSVLKEEEDFVIVDKPAGVKSHPLSLFDNDTVTQWAFGRYPAMRDAFAEALPTVVPHRLDTGTSGILVVAKNPAAYQQWRVRFQEKQVMKAYQAWCWGKPAQAKFEVDVTMAHDSRDRRRMVVVKDGPTPPPPHLPSHSSIQVVEQRGEDQVRVEVVCRTGVTHQVRVHLAVSGFPLVGDRLYDAESAKRSWQPAHHLLRACRLEWPGGAVLAPMQDFETASEK